MARDFYDSYMLYYLYKGNTAQKELIVPYKEQNYDKIKDIKQNQTQ